MARTEYIVINETDGLSKEIKLNEQNQYSQNQILRIDGIEVVKDPDIWIGEYSGQKIFHPIEFKSVDGNDALNIKLGNSMIKSIKNTEFGRYVFEIDENSTTQKIEFDNYPNAFRKLAKK